MKGYNHTLEARYKISEARLGRKHSPETIRKMTISQKRHIAKHPDRYKRGKDHHWYGKHIPGMGMNGKKHTEETKRKMSMSHTGRKHSEETIRKMSKSHRGHIVTEETRKKMRESSIGKPHSSVAGKNHWLYGKHQSEATIKKLSESQTGCNNHNWQGGKSFEPYGAGFNKRNKEQIRIHDNYKCRECNKTQLECGHVLHVHHIDYDKKNNNPNNLISLCQWCHAETNLKRAYWTVHFKHVLNPD